MKKENIKTVRETLPDGSIKDIIIFGLEDGEESYYILLGTGYGLDLAHCLAMGIKNKEDFRQRVFGYRVIPNRDKANLLEIATGDSYISVEFYELS